MIMGDIDHCIGVLRAGVAELSHHHHGEAFLGTFSRYAQTGTFQHYSITAYSTSTLLITYLSDDTEKEQRIGMSAPVKTWPPHQMMTVYLF